MDIKFHKIGELSPTLGDIGDQNTKHSEPNTSAAPQTYDHLPDHLQLMSMIRDVVMPDMGLKPGHVQIAEEEAARQARDDQAKAAVAAFRARLAEREKQQTATSATTRDDPFAFMHADENDGGAG